MRWSQEGAFWLARLRPVSRKEWWSVWPDWRRWWRGAKRSRAAKGSWDIDWGRTLKLATSCKGKGIKTIMCICIQLNGVDVFIFKLYVVLCVYSCVFEIPSITPTLGRAELLSKLLSNADTPKSFRSRSSRADSMKHTPGPFVRFTFIYCDNCLKCGFRMYIFTYRQLTLQSHWWGKRAGH